MFKRLYIPFTCDSITGYLITKLISAVCLLRFFLICLLRGIVKLWISLFLGFGFSGYSIVTLVMTLTVNIIDMKVDTEVYNTICTTKNRLKLYNKYI